MTTPSPPDPPPSPWRSALLNGALALATIAVLVLLYAFGVRSFSPRADALREAERAEMLGDIIQVEVRNGCGEAGVARELTRYLRRRHFDVVGSGNYLRFDVDSTFVIDHVGNREAAAKVATALGLPPSRITTDVKPDLFLDASIVIGLDYRTLPAFTSASFDS